MKKLFSWILLTGAMLSAQASVDMSPVSIAIAVPNPTQNTLQLRLQPDRSSPVAIQRSDLRGHRTGQMDGGIQGAGIQSLSLDEMITGLPSGMYVARVLLGKTSIEHKVLLLPR